MADNFFDLDDSVNLFTIGPQVPTGASVRGLDAQDLIVGSGNPDAIHGNTAAETLYGMDGDDIKDIGDSTTSAKDYFPFWDL